MIFFFNSAQILKIDFVTNIENTLHIYSFEMRPSTKITFALLVLENLF